MKVNYIGPVAYFTQGKGPRLLIRSGTHGDEYEVIEAVKRVVRLNLDKLPSLVFVPEVSPSAVTNRTRQNGAGLDINRHFLPGADEVEIMANKQIVKDHKFELCIDFHEDPVLDKFYFYDTGLLDDEKLKRLKEKVLRLGIGLYTGIDDPNDPLLGVMVEDGYLSTQGAAVEPKTGMFADWAIDRGIIKRCLTLEIPGRLAYEKKAQLVELLFEELVFGDPGQSRTAASI